MAKKNDGGVAFPQALYAECEGMSLRDYLAAAVVNHLHFDVADRLAAQDGPTHDEINDDGVYVVPVSELARRSAVAAYLIADAMLEERAK